MNIINGFHIPDYVKIAAIKAEKKAQENENLERRICTEPGRYLVRDFQ